LLPDRGLKTGYWLGYQGYDFGVRVQMRNATGSILLEDCKLNFAQFHYLNADGSYTVASSINEKIPEKIGLFVRLISGSRAFDRYMKNSVIQIAYRPEPEQLNPFYQAVPVYSNVRGGTGIFAAYTQSLQKIRP
jgi:hypothetical protein